MFYSSFELSKPSVTSIVLVLLSVSPVFTGYSWGNQRKQRPEYGKDSKVTLMPEFEMVSLPNIVVTVGQSALLPCTVHDLGDKVVSWIRTRDLHILTSDIHTYTSDPRFESVHLPDSPHWMLRIKTIKFSDAGVYECQVNTDPKMNLPVTLTVRDSDQHDSPYVGTVASSVANIKGPRERYTKVGSTITFTCEVSPATQHRLALPPPRTRTSGSVEWLHAGREVSFQAARGGISMHTDHTEKVTTSNLIVAKVTEEDSGNYTCSQTDAVPDTVTLIVVQGEHTEAMQRDITNSAHCTTSLTPMYLLLCQSIVYWSLTNFMASLKFTSYVFSCSSL